MILTACTRCATQLSSGARFCSHCGLEAQTTPVMFPRDPSGALIRGTVLEERYKIMKILGQGGFSRVYGAIDLRLRVPCALKENSVLDSGAYEQFVGEAQLLARLRHSHMTKVSDYFVADDGSQFLVMEYVPGKDLEQFLREDPLGFAWRDVATWGKIVCEVLTYLHTHEPPIIHRDIKPGNLRLMPNGTLMVIDLGIAKIHQPGSATQLSAQAYSGGYSSPEQMLGQGTDQASDIYSVGATLYHLLTGEMPVEAVQRLRGARLDPLEQLRPELPVMLSRAIDRSLSLDETQRPPSAQALGMVFERILEQSPESSEQGEQPTAEVWTPPAAQPGAASHVAVAYTPTEPTLPPVKLRIEPLPQNVLWPQDGREMVCIEAGAVDIGCDDFDANEKPQHRINLTAFLIDRFPVTCGEYARFVMATKHPTPPYWGGPMPPKELEDHPVVEISYADAQAYARWAGKRLPTEVEWEKAAGWDTENNVKHVYPWGDEWDANRANAKDGGAGGTVPIGSYTPEGDSPTGVAEMVGNIWEWTNSLYRKYPYDSRDGREDVDTSGLRVTRGGSWTCSPDVIRIANRNVAASNDADFERGFRCAADFPISGES